MNDDRRRAQSSCRRMKELQETRKCSKRLDTLTRRLVSLACARWNVRGRARRRRDILAAKRTFCGCRRMFSPNRASPMRRALAKRMRDTRDFGGDVTGWNALERARKNTEHLRTQSNLVHSGCIKTMPPSLAPLNDLLSRSLVRSYPSTSLISFLSRSRNAK